MYTYIYLCVCVCEFHGASAPSGPGSPHYRGSTITLRHNILGRTPLDEWSALHRDLYLTTYKTHRRQTSMPPWRGSNPTPRIAHYYFDLAHTNYVVSTVFVRNTEIINCQLLGKAFRSACRNRHNATVNTADKQTWPERSFTQRFQCLTTFFLSFSV
jgi:hypothetical protein